MNKTIAAIAAGTLVFVTTGLFTGSAVQAIGPNDVIFHTPNSYWSYPIQDAPLDPNNDYYIEHWKSIASTHSIRMNSVGGSFGFALWFGTESDPVWTATHTATGQQFQFRGPADAHASPGDAEVAFIDTTQDGGNGVLYKFGGTSFWNQSNRTFNAGFRAVNYLKSNGLEGSLPNADDVRNIGHRGLSIMTFGFLVDEVRDLYVPRMVKLTVPRSGKSPFNTRDNHVWPYAGNEGDTTNLPEGTRVRLKASVQPRIDAMPNPYARAMAQSLMDFGSIISDQSAEMGNAINIKVQVGGGAEAEWADMGISAGSLAEFTVDDFEFVELGWVPPGT
jgi:hypothetical protein